MVDQHELQEQAQKDEIESLMRIKFEAIRIDKQLQNLDSINPLTIKIEEISKLPEDLPISAERDKDNHLVIKEGKGTKEVHVAEQRDGIMAEMRELLDGHMRDDEVDELMEELFTETFEQDSWLNQYAKPERNYMFRKKIPSENINQLGARSQSQRDGPAPASATGEVAKEQ